MKIAIICATPYQTFNALNLIMNIFSDKNNKIDLYYRNFNKVSAGILENIKKENLVEHIYEYNIVEKRLNFIYLYNVLMQVISTKKYLELLLKNKESLKNKYDLITVTSGTEFEIAFTKFYAMASTIAYDDGLGSYVGDIIHHQNLNFFWRIIRNSQHIQPICLYINNKEFCDSTISNSYIQFPRYPFKDKEKNKIIGNVFDYSNELKSNNRIIYLTQPLTEISRNIYDKNNEIEKIIFKNRRNITIRIHPRDKIKRTNQNINISKANLWELVCANEVNKNHILISYCSTAQIIPKIMFNKEPYIIFLYKLIYKELSDKLKTKFNSIVDKVTDIYNEKNKVIIPKSQQELIEIINKLESENK